MKKLLIQSIAQETLKSANNVGVYVHLLQKNLDEFLSFETRATRSANNAELIEIFYQEENDEDDSLTFKVLSFNFVR